MKKRLFFMLALLMSAFNGWAQEVVINHIRYCINARGSDYFSDLYDPAAGNTAFAAQYLQDWNGEHVEPTSISFEENVTIGGEVYQVTRTHPWGFQLSSLKSVSIPKTMKEAPEFWGASNIDYIVVDPENPDLDSRDNCNCIIRTADNRVIRASNMAVIPASASSRMDYGVFNYCKNIYIPKHVTEFEGWAAHLLNSAETLVVEEDNPSYFSPNNSLCLIEKTTNKLISVSPNAPSLPDIIESFGGTSLQNYSGIINYTKEYPTKLIENPLGVKCILVVPEGTIPRYLYQNWGNAFKKITDGTAIYYGQPEGDTWFAPHIDVLTAKAGEGVDLSVVLNADRPVTGFQFDLYLPDGVAVTTDDEGYEDIFLSTARTTTRKHELTAQQQANGSWRVLCYSNSNQTFEGNEGEVCTIHVSTSAGLEGKGYPIILRNVVTSYLDDNGDVKQSERSELTSYINFFTPEPLLFGDANNDKSVNVTDIATIVSYIMGRSPSQFVFSLADAYPDGQINVSDITATVSIILNGNSQPQSTRRKMRRQVQEGTVTANLEVIPFAISSGEEKEVEVLLNNPDDDFTGLQFDLVLPDGIELVSDDIGYFVDLGSRTNSRKHTIEAALQGDGSIRVMAYSSRNSNFTGSEGDVVKLTLKADNNLKAGVYNIQLKNIVLSQANGNDINQMEPADYEGSILSGLIAENPIIKGDITAEAATVISNSMAESVTSIDLTQAIAVAEDAEFTTANPNTLIFVADGVATVNTQNVIAGDVCANLVLSDAAAFATPRAFTATKATVNRTVNANSYATVAVPFALDETQIKAAFGNDATIYAYNEASEVGDVINLAFKTATSAEANVPFLALTSTPHTSLIFDDVEVAKGIPVKTISNVSFCGNYNGQVTIPENDFFIAQNKLYRSTGKSQISGFRAYLIISGTNVKEMYLDIDGQATSISGVNETATTEDIYDLQGRKVLRMDRGVYISSGKKMIK